MASQHVLSQIDQMVGEVLTHFRSPYPQDITNQVFKYIETDQTLLPLYYALEAEYAQINSRIGWRVADNTGLSEIGRTSRNKSRLIKTSYALLGRRS